MTFENVDSDLHISMQNVFVVYDRYVEYTLLVLPEVFSFNEKNINNKMTDNVYFFSSLVLWIFLFMILFILDTNTNLKSIS